MLVFTTEHDFGAWASCELSVDSAEVLLDPCLDLLGDRESGGASQESLEVDEVRVQRFPRVRPVALARGDALSQNEVVGFQAPRDRRFAAPDPRCDLALDEALLPASRSACRLRPNAMGVIAKGAMKLRAIAKGAVDEIGCSRITERVDVGLQRLQHRTRRRGKRAEDCLAAHDDEFALAGDVRRRGDEVLKFVEPQSDHLTHDAEALRLAQETGERRVLPQVVAVLAFVDEGLPEFGERTVEQALPSVGVAWVDPPILSPTGEHMPGFIDHLLAQLRCQRAVIGEAPSASAVMPASAVHLLELGQVQPICGFALASDHRREHIPRSLSCTLCVDGIP
jgi:hypothetical protein